MKKRKWEEYAKYGDKIFTPIEEKDLLFKWQNLLRVRSNTQQSKIVGLAVIILAVFFFAIAVGLLNIPT